jgi:peptide/nickel transport system substrate-binding protein
MKKHRLGAIAAAAALSAATLLGGCSSSSGSKTSTPTTTKGSDSIRGGFVNTVVDAGQPRKGGTLQVGDYNSYSDLDPATATGIGAGDSVLIAIYDALMRYDGKTNTWQPQMAQSVSPSDGNRTWTLKLRPGVKFTDGTPLDSAAVVASMKRYATLGKGTNASQMKIITSYDTPDASTVVFHLAQPWLNFPYLLATTSGMITSPAAVKAEGDGFKTRPVGAGPFKFASLAPGREVKLVRNADYWGGSPNLDGVTFTASVNQSLNLDQLQSGADQLIHVSDSATILKGLSAHEPGWLDVASGYGLQVNTGRKPGSDVKVRQAIAMALNLKQVNQRVTQGRGLYGPDLLWPGSPWAPATKGVQYNLTQAKSLVEQAKKDLGWDGSLRYVSLTTDPTYGLTIQAQLDAAGFKVNLVNATSTNDLVQKVYLDQNFDIADSSLQVWDSDPWSTLAIGYARTAFFKYHNATIDAQLKAFGTAPTKEAAKAELAKIQQSFNEQQPFIVTGGAPYGYFFSKKLHGVVTTENGTLILSKAFLAS